jgi:hypothetical protein
MERTRTGGWILTLAVLAALAAGTVYDGALALGLTEVGPLPGDSPPGESLVLVAYAALLAGGLLFILAACTRVTADAVTTPLLPFVGLAAVVFTVAHYFSYDDYAAPSLIRVSEASSVSGWWVVLLALGGVWAGFVTRRIPRAGPLVQGAFLWAVAFALFAIGPWH